MAAIGNMARGALLAAMLVMLIAGPALAQKPAGKASKPAGAKEAGTDCKTKVIYRYLSMHKYAEGTDLAKALDLEIKSLSNCTSAFYRAVVGLDLGIGQSIFGASAPANWQFSKILDFETLDGPNIYKACQKASIATISASEKSKIIYNVTACPSDSITGGYVHGYIYNITTKPANAAALAKIDTAVDSLNNQMPCIYSTLSNGADNGVNLGEPQNFHPYGGATAFSTVNLVRAFWANALGPPTNPYLVTATQAIDNAHRLQFTVNKIK